MKTSMTRFTALATSIALLALPAHGLTMRRVDVTIPFAFTAGTEVLASGRYHLQKEGADHMLVRNENGDVVANLATAPLPTSEPHDAKAIVVFNIYGQDRFLSEIRAAGYGIGLSVARSRVEREAAAREKGYSVAVDATVAP